MSRCLQGCVELLELRYSLTPVSKFPPNALLTFDLYVYLYTGRLINRLPLQLTPWDFNRPTLEKTLYPRNIAG